MSKDTHALTWDAGKKSLVVACKINVYNVISGNHSETYGVWDTGATSSAITASLAKELKLILEGKAQVHGVHGNKNVNVYVIKIVLPNNVPLMVKAIECDQLLGDKNVGMLIGMDVITMGDFAITNYENKTVLSFRCPSRERIDFVEDLNIKKRLNQKFTGKRIRIKKPLGGNNAPCPCGSNKKFRDCHGKKF